jgi:hypothetical protein
LQEIEKIRRKGFEKSRVILKIILEKFRLMKKGSGELLGSDGKLLFGFVSRLKRKEELGEMRNRNRKCSIFSI